MNLKKQIKENKISKNKVNKYEDNKTIIDLKKQIKEKLSIISLIVIILMVIALIIIFFNSINTNKSQFNKCEDIVLNSYRTSCLMYLANTTENISICNAINPIDKNQCISNIATLENNANLCTLINNSTASSNCTLNISIITKNQIICNNLSGSYKASCLYHFAKLNNFNNINNCKSITNISDQNICTNLFYYNKMIKTKNQNYCSKVINQTNFTILYLMLNNKNKLFNSSTKNNLNLSNIKTNILNNSQKISSSIIELVSNNVTLKNFCYFKSALISKNSSICNSTGYLKNICMNKFNKQQLNNKTNNFTDQINDCNELISYNLTSLCRVGVYTTYAINTKNISICLKINNINYRNICIGNMAQKLNNLSYCNYLSNATIKSSCEQTLR